MVVALKTMSTEDLKIEVNKAIQTLRVLFAVIESEFAKFREPEIKRNLRPDEYPEHNRRVPAYSPIDNFIYFPLNDDSIIPGELFIQSVIHHEVGHYMHNFVNPCEVENVRIFLRTGEMPPGHCEFGQIVAEYGNLILGLRDYSDSLVQSAYGEAIEVYREYGPDFLPSLARMSLEEVIERGIVKIE